MINVPFDVRVYVQGIQAEISTLSFTCSDGNKTEFTIAASVPWSVGSTPNLDTRPKVKIRAVPKKGEDNAK